MAFTKINHVGILVTDLEIGRQVYCTGWGLQIDEHRSPWPEGRQGTFDDVTSIEIPIGEMYLEISKPNSQTSEAARFVSQRPGLYYVSIASDDIESDVKMLTDRGVQLARWNPEGKRAELDPSTTLGLRIEIVNEENYYVHPYHKGDGTITGMAHIGIAARNADEVRHLFGEIFGLHEDKSVERGKEPPRDWNPERPAGDPVHLLEYPIGGSVIEISIPTVDDSGTARLVAQRATSGAVYHHICPFTPDVHKAVERGVDSGLQQIGTIAPREETTRVVAWFHPRTCCGVLTELWNRPPGGEHDHTHGRHPGP